MENLSKYNLAIIGGGKFCKGFLELFFSENFVDQKPEILGVAALDEYAQGIKYAKQMGIFTTNNYKNLYKLENLNLIIELTGDYALSAAIRNTKPNGVRLINHFEAGFLWNSLQIEKEKINALRKLSDYSNDSKKTIDLFKQFANRMEEIVTERTAYSLKIEKDMVEHQRTISQIIEGSTLPTFVINKNHIVTHWNKALEKFSGYPASEIVGTRKQWKPFRTKERPIMADVILDQFEEEKIRKYYGANWRKSTLIEGAYEAEEFFSHIGENGKWVFFTGAPIKAPDGKIVGAIETLWDTTDNKNAEKEREHHTRELATLCSIYTALNTSSPLKNRINDVINEIKNFLSANSISIFLLQKDKRFHLTYYCSDSQTLYEKNKIADQDSIVARVAKNANLNIFKEIPDSCKESGLLKQENLISIAYIPMIVAKAKNVIGVIRIGSKISDHFKEEDKNLLELIGNRVGVAIENSGLQEQYIKSEEKYRSLFNNDPNPIFIIDCNTLKILDTNQRAETYYEYSRKDLSGFSFLKLGDENDQELLHGLKNISKDQSVLFSKKRHYKKGHIPFYVTINASYATYREKDVLIATTTDVTESVEKETQLIQASKMTTLGVMASGMAHEINQPLNVIQVCSDFFKKSIAKGQKINEQNLKMLSDDISNSVQRAAGIIKHMRDFARQSEAIRSKVNINDPIKDVFKVLGHQLKVHQIELKLNIAPDIPYIMAEHNRLEQVFINLVTNAVDAMDDKVSKSESKGSKKLLEIKSFTENDKVVVTVSDTGTGMSQDVIEKIFEPFFTTKDIGKGTGLGVSISYGIVKDYDGDIKIHSEIGKGTTFKIIFPVVH